MNIVHHTFDNLKDDFVSRCAHVIQSSGQFCTQNYKLAMPVYNLLIFDILLKILKCACSYCHRFKYNREKKLHSGESCLNIQCGRAIWIFHDWSWHFEPPWRWKRIAD